MKKFKPICLAFEYVNLDRFLFPKEDLYHFTKTDTIHNLPVRLIHAHFGHIGFRSLKLKRRFGIPLITTFYGSDASKLPRKRRWKKNYRILFKEGDLFLVEGNNMRSKLIELGCPKEKIQIQRIAIPLQKISFIPRKNTDKDKVIFLFSGRFVEKKGLIYALQAIDKIKHKFRDFEFHIIGDGPLKKEIERYINHHNLQGIVKMLGFLTYDEYLIEMSKSDIFIHPSITANDGDSEGGAPTTILEAQAFGMPVISTFHADIPNVVVPGKSALLSKEKDVDSLADNMTYLLKNPQVWKGMGQIGREFIQAFHDIKCEVGKLEEKYNSILKQGHLAMSKYGGCSSAG